MSSIASKQKRSMCLSSGAVRKGKLEGLYSVITARSEGEEPKGEVDDDDGYGGRGGRDNTNPRDLFNVTCMSVI